MKKHLLIIILLLLNVLTVFVADDGESLGEIYDGETVYIDNENAYLSANPHTINKDGWVTFTVRSKDYEGDIDAVWLFDTTNCRPTQPVYYKIGDGAWNLLEKEFDIRDINYENMTKAYSLKDVTIVKDVNYSLKTYVDMKSHTSGKYWYGVKPSALTWEHGYYIDPFWGDFLDFTTFTEVDNGNDRIQVTADRCTWTNMSRNEEVYLYKDYGAGYWGNAWRLNFTFTVSSTVNQGLNHIVSMSNYLGGFDSWDAGLGVYLYQNGGTLQIGLVSRNTTTDYYYEYGHDGTKIYYADMIRTGSNLDLGLYNDEARTSLIDSLHTTSDVADGFRYLYGVTSSHTHAVAFPFSGYVEFLGDIGHGVSPFVTNENPADESIGVPIYPNVNVTVEDVDDEDLDVYWLSNSSGEWLEFGQNLTVDGSSLRYISQSNANFSVHETTYWWSVNVTDGFFWTNETYHFTTNDFVIVKVNATTDIEETSVTHIGYIDTGGIGLYYYGFWVGLISPVTEDNFLFNVSGGGTIDAQGSNRTFTYHYGGLDDGTRHYVTAWVKNATFFTNSAEEDSFATKPYSPETLILTSGEEYLSLSWTKNTSSAGTKSVVVKKADSYPTDVTDGTVVQNSTSTSYDDYDVFGTHYFYRIWNHFNPFSDGYIEGNISVPPKPPTNIDSNVLENYTLQMTWVKGEGAFTTLIVKKLGSYPTSITDGTELYNNTGEAKIIPFTEERYYYSMWSYANETYSEQVNFSVGGLVTRCYDEETNESLIFDVAIFNQDGSQTYESKNNTNPLILNISQLPQGDKTRFIFSASQVYADKSQTFTGYLADENTTSTYIVLNLPPKNKVTTNVTTYNGSTPYYPPFTIDDDVITIQADDSPKFDKIVVTYQYNEYRDRIYYRDLGESSYYSIKAYLPPTADSSLYQMNVLDEFNQPVQNAYMVFKRYIDGVFEEVSSLYTSASGTCELYLMDGEQYKIIISKNNYQIEIADITTDSEIRVYNFKLLFSGSIPDTNYSILHNMTFSLEPYNYQHNPHVVVYFNITSSDNSLEWFSINIYYNNRTDDTYTLIYSYNDTVNSSGGSVVYNISGEIGRYVVVCSFKKTGFPIYTVTFDYWTYHTVITQVDSFPDEVWLIATIVLMLVVMGFLARYGAGAFIGIAGIIIMAMMFALKPDMEIGGVSAWWILLSTTVVYVVLVYLMRGK